MQKYLIAFFIVGSLFIKQGAAETVSANKGTPESDSIQLLYFTASWCGSCQMMKQDT